MSKVGKLVRASGMGLAAGRRRRGGRSPGVRAGREPGRALAGSWGWLRGDEGVGGGVGVQVAGGYPGGQVFQAGLAGEAAQAPL